jgi:hypothetical protein
MTDMPLAALIRAWQMTLLATLLLVAAVVLSRIWDSTDYLRALQQALAFDG